MAAFAETRLLTATAHSPELAAEERLQPNVRSLPVANVSTDCFELTGPVEACFSHDDGAGAAAKEMPEPKRMK